MRTLNDYQRLETPGVWRQSHRDPGWPAAVLITVRGLTIISKDNEPLAHWSLDAVRQLNPGRLPGIFTPDDHGSETVEIADSHVVSLLANQLNPVGETAPPPTAPWAAGLAALALTAALAAGAFVFSDDIAGGMAGLVSAAQRAEIGERAFTRMTETAGGRCRTTAGDRALAKLGDRLFGDGTELRVIRGGERIALLPGGILVIPEALLKAHDGFAALCGFLLEEHLRAAGAEPMAALFRSAGLRAAAGYVLRGRIDDAHLTEFADSQMRSGRAAVDPDALFAAFQAAGLPSAPFARASGWSGPLLERDPGGAGDARPPLSDREWLELRNMCLGSPFDR